MAIFFELGGVREYKKLTLINEGSGVAILGGSLTTVGITSADVSRCDSVIVPSELGHMMTMGECAMVLPKPLQAGV
jgi:hypothetical protein